VPGCAAHRDGRVKEWRGRRDREQVPHGRAACTAVVVTVYA
jgi:hypothetical protein